MKQLNHIVDVRAFRRSQPKHDRKPSTQGIKASTDLVAPLINAEERKGTEVEQLFHHEGSFFMKPLFSTHHVYKILKSKLRILSSVLLILEESISAVRYSASFAMFIASDESKKWYHNLQNLDLEKSLLVDSLHIDGLAEEADEERETEDYPSLYLTLAHTFVYMVNYYLFAPTANLYTEALGFSKSLSGVLMAMTPIASIMFAFLLSW